MTFAQNPISVEWHSGAVSNASLLERTGLLAMGAAARVLAPLHGYGFSYVAQVLKALFPSNRAVCVRIDEDLQFSFPYGDGYWSLFLKPGFIYEEEVEDLLRAVQDIDYLFVDCGANFGYWSAKVTSKRFGSRPAIAVELDPENFRWLKTNATLNRDRFECLNRAIFDKDGETLKFYGRKHETRSVEGGEGAGDVLGEVRSVTLDRLLDETGKDDHSKIVLKLDVEGVEIKALQGAEALLQKDVLVIYEDHGNDRSHAVSRYLSETGGMRIFAHAQNRFFEVGNVSELDGLKTNRRKGYDFFATRSQFWLERLAGLSGSTHPQEPATLSVAQ